MHFGLLALSIVGRDKRAAKTGGAFALEQARSLGQALCVFWADGIHVGIGATPEGKKELVGLIDGVRESANCIVARSRRRSLGQPSRQQNEKAREKSRAFIVSAW
jgi:hypothetical protein